MTVIPSFKHVAFHFILGDFGPFRPQVPAKMPLWLAIRFKKRQQLRIQAPDWLTADSLTEALEYEKREVTFSPTLPFHFHEVASLLFAK